MSTEANTVEHMLLDAVAQRGGTPASMVREDSLPYGGESLGDDLCPARWTYTSHTDVPRQLSDVMVEPWVREALIRLNPDIAAQPDRADEVIYNLRACSLSVPADGLAARREDHALWPQRRACAGAAGRRRAAGQQPAHCYQSVDLSGWCE